MIYNKGITILIFAPALIVLAIFGTIYTMFPPEQQAQATGGGEVIELVIPMIDETIKSVQNGDTEKAISQLEEIKTELQDTFFAEEEN